MKWTDAIMLVVAALCLLAWTSCDYPLPGEAIARTAETEQLHSAVDDLAHAWEQDSTLPSIDTQRCTDALAEVELRTAAEDEWIRDLRLCPRMPSGCSTRGGCGPVCATGVVYRMSGRWRVFLSPGESADGHAATVRHETAHVLSWCTTGALDYGHSTPGVWGAGGVVWRMEER